MDSISKILSNSAKEKIYIHFDKSFYFPGDTVWFKAYLFDGSTRAKESKNLYIQLADQNNTLIDQAAFPIFESTASGSLLLPTTSSLNTIICKAFTVKILNDDNNYIYTKTLFTNSVTSTDEKKSFKLRFFPEGGDWIVNTPSVMAFAATDGNDMPINVTGKIMIDNQLVTEFHTTHDGMGAIALLPNMGAKYIARWSAPDGKEYSTNLPPPLTTGVMIHTSNIRNSKKFTLFRANEVQNASTDYFIIAHINGQVIYQAKVTLTNSNVVTGIIPTAEASTGILYITIYDVNFKPLAERISFINNNEYRFKLNTETTLINKKNYGLNEIKLSTVDSVRSNLSVSVTDADQDAIILEKDNIISRLLLTTDLRGKIINPDYYFSNSGEEVDRNIDLVMLTHGWRKFNIQRDLINPRYKESNFIGINGSLQGDYKTIKRLAGSEAAIVVENSKNNTGISLIPIHLDENGHFFKDGLIFYGDVNLNFQFKVKTPNEVFKIMISNELLQTTNLPVSSTDKLIDEETHKDIVSRNVLRYNDASTKQLKEVTIKGHRQSEVQALNKTYASGMFIGGGSKDIAVGTDPDAVKNLSIFQYLQNKVGGLQIFSPLSNNPSVSWRNEGVNFFLNNFESTIADIREVPMTEFDYIKIYDPSMGGAFNSRGGVIALYTKKGKGQTIPKTITKELSGYAIYREFYSTKYVEGVSVNNKDKRETLYWNPNLIFGQGKKETLIQFYNNSVAKRYKITIEGINYHNQLIHFEKIY